MDEYDMQTVFVVTSCSNRRRILPSSNNNWWVWEIVTKESRWVWSHCRLLWEENVYEFRIDKEGEEETPSRWCWGDFDDEIFDERLSRIVFVEKQVDSRDHLFGRFDGSVGLDWVLCLISRSKDIQLITNVEVFQALTEGGTENALSGSGEYPWMRAMVLQYLSMTPASHLSDEKSFFNDL